MINLILAGVGGQGIITASKIILETALRCGHNVRSAETIGMAQKGGSVCSHIRIGQEIYSPLITYKQANEIILLDGREASRYVPYLKQNGLMKIVFYEKQKVDKSEINLDKKVAAIYYDFQKIYFKLGTKRVENVAMLGASFCKSKQPFGIEDIEETIKKKYKGNMLRKNLEALYLGYEIGRCK
jgi:indolepyruvate ferredoxin oxidoreductase, beta subunit